MKPLHLKAIEAILVAEGKAKKLIEADIEPPIDTDNLIECLTAFLQRDMGDVKAGEFIYDLYCLGGNCLTANEIYNKYF